MRWRAASGGGVRLGVLPAACDARGECLRLAVVLRLPVVCGGACGLRRTAAGGTAAGGRPAPTNRCQPTVATPGALPPTPLSGWCTSAPALGPTAGSDAQAITIARRAAAHAGAVGAHPFVMAWRSAPAPDQPRRMRPPPLGDHSQLGKPDERTKQRAPRSKAGPPAHQAGRCCRPLLVPPPACQVRSPRSGAALSGNFWAPSYDHWFPSSACRRHQPHSPRPPRHPQRGASPRGGFVFGGRWFRLGRAGLRTGLFGGCGFRGVWRW